MSDQLLTADSSSKRFKREFLSRKSKTDGRKQDHINPPPQEAAPSGVQNEKQRFKPQQWLKEAGTTEVLVKAEEEDKPTDRGH